MGIAKHVKNAQPGETVGDDNWSVSHSKHGSYSWSTSSPVHASGWAPYGGSLPSQRDAIAHVATRIRGVMNNRTKDQRRSIGGSSAGNGTAGQPALTEL